MNYLREFFDLIKKNRLVIYGVLIAIIVLQICSRGNQHVIDKVKVDNQEQLIVEEGLNDLDHQKEPGNRNEQKDNGFVTLLLMAVVVMGFFVIKRYGLLEKLYPKVFIFRVHHYKDRKTGNLILKFYIINQTKDSVSLNSPEIEFFNGKEKRQFVIKNIGGNNYFPMVLANGVGHKFVIDVQKFYNHVDGLSSFKTIRATISTVSGKKYRSMKWPLWLTHKK